MQFEINLITSLQDHISAGFAGLASLLSMFGEQTLLVGIVVFFYFCYDKDLGRRMALSLMSALVWCTLLKNLVLRPRPYIAHREIECLRPVTADADVFDVEAQGYSFPSMHSSNSVSCYGSAAREYKKKWMLVCAVLIPLLVGFSRVFVGVHYPSDVLCGWTLGLCGILFINYLNKRTGKRELFYLVLILLGLPGLFYCKTEDYYTSYGMLVGMCAGFYFEEKKVNFEIVKEPVKCIIRMLLGVGIFLGIAQGCKLFLPATLYTRLFRYALACFVSLGIYPMFFKKFSK